METIVEVVNLCKNFGKEEILKNVSFTIQEQEIVGFIGPNGAGKSTTMKCLCNLIFPTSGTIKICGHDIIKEREKALACLGAQIESPGLYPELNGLEHLKLFAKLRGVSKQRMEEIIAFMQLEPKQLKKKTRYYSMGMKQRLALGIVLLGKPQFLILDEPTNGLDPKAIMELREILHQLVKNEHISILFSSHALGEIEKIADRIICINHGKIIPTPPTLLDEHIYDFTLSKAIDVTEFKKLPYVLNAQSHQDKIEISFEKQEDLQTFLHYCNKMLDCSIIDVTKKQQDIETIYQEVYGDGA